MVLPTCRPGLKAVDGTAVPDHHPACDGFDRVAVDDVGPVVRLAIVTGQLASAPEVCTLIATSQRAAFALPTPIILGGASPA